MIAFSVEPQMLDAQNDQCWFQLKQQIEGLRNEPWAVVGHEYGSRWWISVC